MIGLSALVSFSVCCISVFLLARFADKLSLIDKPSEHRQHKIETPMVGGLAMFLGLASGYLLFNQLSVGLLFCLFLICLLGAVDDRLQLPSWLRFICQGLITYLMINLTGIELQSLGILFSNQELLLQNWSVPITIFATIGVINALNMSDGLDGLAGCLTLIVLVALLSISGFQSPLIILSIAMLVGFLVWNLRVKRKQAYVFMGDAGSTMLGFLLSVLLISYSQTESGFMPVTALWLLALPLVDAVGVHIVRPMRGQSPFKADRLHYHHQLIDMGFSVNKTLIFVLVVQSILILIGLSLWKFNVNENSQLIGFLLFFFCYLIHLFRFSKNEAV